MDISIKMFENLNPDLSLTHEDLRLFIPTVVGLLSFVLFWFVSQSEKFKSRMLAKYGQDEGTANVIIHSKILGGLSMGLIPTAAYFIAFPATSLADLGIGLSSDKALATLLWTLALGVVMFFLVWNNARKPESLVHYPQIRVSHWTRRMMMRNILGWTVYLVGYEILFRGVLLFPLVESIGLWPAIGVNIAIYSGTHIPKGLKETLGAIPLSVALCLICVYTGNIWVAVIVHLVMAYTNTLTSFKYHPDMSYNNS